MVSLCNFEIRSEEFQRSQSDKQQSRKDDCTTQEDLIRITRRPTLQNSIAEIPLVHFVLTGLCYFTRPIIAWKMCTVIELK